jgi:hypothetical protein
LPNKIYLKNILMKNLSISLSLILMAVSIQTAFATQVSAFTEQAEYYSVPQSDIETFFVYAKQEVAGFEIYSEKHSQKAIAEIMNGVVANIRNDAKRNDS